MEKLYWEAIHNCDFNKTDNFMESILKSKGVEDIPALLNVNKDNEFSPFLFNNMEKGLILLSENLGKGKKLFIQVDPDVDGYTSASVAYQVIKRIAPETEIVYGVHEGKEHGLICDEIDDFESFDLFIIPDASIEEKEFENFAEMTNAKILILDHHQISEKLLKEPNVVLINCNDGNYPNKGLAGVGVVYKFFKAYEEFYDTESIVDDYIDLVGLGLIADSMDMRSLETRFLALKGLKDEHRKNMFIEELSDRLSEDMKLGHTFTSYGWVIAPKLNGCIRFGKQHEKVDMFRAMIGEYEDSEYQPRKKRGTPKTDPRPPIEIHSLQKRMARVVCNAKGRQDTSVRTIMKKVDNEIIKLGLNADSIIIVDGTELIKEKTLTGLIANKLASKYHRPVVILKKTHNENIKEEVFGGSGRAYSEGSIKDLKDFLTDFGTFEKCAGHQGAFGVEIRKSNIERTREIANAKIGKQDLITIHKVDYEIDSRVLTNDDIKQVADAYQIWGTGIKEPTFAITNIKINAKDIIGYGENKGFIKFNHNGIDYIKKYCPKGNFDELTLTDRFTLGENTKELIINVVGSFTYNVFNDAYYPQVRINHFYTEERKEELNIDDIF